MNFLKKNIKLFIGILIGLIIASSIAVYATYSYFAEGVGYTRQGSNVENVEQALNELYGYIASGADYEIITNKVVAGADINNTYVCDYIPKFFFMKIERSDGEINWIYGADNCSSIMIWEKGSTLPYDALQYNNFIVNSYGIKFGSGWQTSVTRTLNIWIIK